jgi:hypothetical protein
LPVIAGQEAWCWGEERRADGTTERTRITRDDFPPTIDGYYLRVALAARSYLAGAAFVTV